MFYDLIRINTDAKLKAVGVEWQSWVLFPQWKVKFDGNSFKAAHC